MDLYAELRAIYCAIRKERIMKADNEQKNFVIRCGGGVKAYITQIIKKPDEPPVYVYGTKDKSKAMRFTQAEALKLAKDRKGTAVRYED